ncbi:MAG: hypothetical protein SGJ18_12340 [Pseudomonadota bacterium]|nr:hypothetical protein [Pseudomonadota bacterium]
MQKLILTSAAILANLAQAESIGPLYIDRYNADTYGINFEMVEQAFYNQAKINLNWEDLLSVTADQEGKNIRFSTADSITVTVPVMDLAPAPNKGI